jgi:hypothetical protein
MKETDTEETFFREIMSKSKLDVPFTDFDDNVMELIEKKLAKKTSISRDIKLSWVFFILGSIFGIIVTIILPKVRQTVFGITSDRLILPFLIIFSFLLLTQIDNLIDFYSKHYKSTKRYHGKG